MKNVIKPLANSISIPLRLTAVASAVDAGKQNKVLGSANKTPIISNDETEDIIKIVKSLGDSGLLLKGVSKTVQNEPKEHKGEFLSILLDTLGGRLLGNILTGRGNNRAGESIAGAGYGNEKWIFNAASSFT